MGFVLGDRVRYRGTGDLELWAWIGDGEITDSVLHHRIRPGGAVMCHWVDWDNAEAPNELRGWIPEDMLEAVGEVEV